MALNSYASCSKQLIKATITQVGYPLEEIAEELEGTQPFFLCSQFLLF